MGGEFNRLLFELAARSDQQMMVRDTYSSILRAEQSAAAAAPEPISEAAAVVDIAQSAFGDLRGLIASLTELDLDRLPGEGEWPIREVLGHVLHVERRYAFQVRYAVERAESDPVYLNPTLELDEADRAGGPREWIERLEQTRAGNQDLTRIAPDDLLRPTVWSGLTVDVRFRLHRFAEHLSEHTIHCQRQLQLEGVPMREAVEWTRRISAMRGRHELRSSPETLAELDRGHSALAASITGRSGSL